MQGSSKHQSQSPLVHLALAANERKIPVQGGACRMEESANLGVIIPDNAQGSVGAPSDGEYRVRSGPTPPFSLRLPSFQCMQPSQSKVCQEQETVSLIRASIASNCCLGAATMSRPVFDLCLK